VGQVSGASPGAERMNDGRRNRRGAPTLSMPGLVGTSSPGRRFLVPSYLSSSVPRTVVLIVLVVAASGCAHVNPVVQSPCLLQPHIVPVICNYASDGKGLPEGNLLGHSRAECSETVVVPECKPTEQVVIVGRDGAVPILGCERTHERR
jgi:hypothetical protein